MNNTIYFDAFKKHAAGVWYFTPCEEYDGCKPCRGSGAIKYPEGSIYQGDIYFDGKFYHKLGFGTQDFVYSTIGILNPTTKEKTWLFVGEFDYTKTNWIYGNGVLYFADAENKPTHFVKGFFSCLDKIKEYEGEFDYNSLIDGYTKDMEIKEYNPHLQMFLTEFKAYKKMKKVENLFVGDSYFEFWNYEAYAGKNGLFNKVFDPKVNLNVGVGGSTFEEWLNNGYLPYLKDINEPKHIIINLGFNDVNMGHNIERIYDNYQKVLSILRESFPNSKYYLLQTAYSAPIAEAKIKESLQWNELIIKNADKDNVTILYQNDFYLKNDPHWYHEDDCHPNPIGYEILRKLVKEKIGF